MEENESGIKESKELLSQGMKNSVFILDVMRFETSIRAFATKMSTRLVEDLSEFCRNVEENSKKRETQ